MSIGSLQRTIFHTFKAPHVDHSLERTIFALLEEFRSNIVHEGFFVVDLESIVASPGCDVG